jgi:hypothetical protein
LVLFVINLIILLNFKKAKRDAFSLIKDYQTKCSDEKILISNFENSYKFQGKVLLVNNDSLKKGLLKNSTITPLLLIRQNVCTVCFDALLLELEKMRSDSLPLIKNLIVVQWNESNNTKRNGITSIFKAKNTANYTIDRDDLNILNENSNSFPDMIFVLIDMEHRILSACEFSTSYPILFSRELTFLNANYFSQ